MKRIPLLILCLIVLKAGAASAMPAGSMYGTYENEFVLMPVHHTLADGKRGVLDRPDIRWLSPGSELPVARGEEIIGILRVDYIGGLHVWGSLFSHEPEMRLMPGDTVIAPLAPPEVYPAGFPVSLEPARVVYHFPAGHSYWAFVNRGVAHGLLGAQTGAVNRNRAPVGDFKVIYAGENFSYGIFAPYELDSNPDYKSLDIVFPAR